MLRLLSRTPNVADIDRPEAQMPMKSAPATILADRPLGASMRNSSPGEVRIARNCADLPTGVLVFLFYAPRGRQSVIL